VVNEIGKSWLALDTISKEIPVPVKYIPPDLIKDNIKKLINDNSNSNNINVNNHVET
jgi:hypothetical protein